MEMNCIVPMPITLNCWKHHAGVIKDQTNLLQKNIISKAELHRLLLMIGESQMDLYMGKLNPKQIANEIINNVKNSGVKNYTNYSKWLSADGRSYKQIEISDSSVWTLRLGKEKKRYMHIHPGRYSPLTIRVKAATLKTTIAIMVLVGGIKGELPELKSINEVRTVFLKLPPLKSVSLSSGIGKFLNRFNQDLP
jgi:hypothetical protein